MFGMVNTYKNCDFPISVVFEKISEALLRLMFGAENFTMDMEQATTLQGGAPNR